MKVVNTNLGAMGPNAVAGTVSLGHDPISLSRSNYTLSSRHLGKHKDVESNPQAQGSRRSSIFEVPRGDNAQGTTSVMFDRAAYRPSIDSHESTKRIIKKEVQWIVERAKGDLQR